MKYNRVIVWFRNDLRIHDNVTLLSAVENAKEVIPLYCFDPRSFEHVEINIKKTGKFKTKFLIQSVDNLRLNLKNLGSNLVLRIGKPEDIVPQLVTELAVDAIYYSEEVTSEEKVVAQNLEKACWKNGIEMVSFWQSTLFHVEDLPFPINQLPEVFTQFRKACEKQVNIRKCLPSSRIINFPKLTIDLGILPSLEEFGFGKSPEIKQTGVLDFHGGEEAGLERLQNYIFGTDSLRSYKETRNGLLGSNYSSKFSAWLALGCISPRMIFEEVKRYEKERITNDSTYWMIFELIWRDYFRFICKKHGDQVFKLQGIKDREEKWSTDEDIFWKWANGETGIPFIDANMRELNQTGFMSNRGRQIVASFLVNDLKIDWRWGAMYFESKLIDYDVCSNWGNWMYVAGVGNDPRDKRYFNTLKQAKNYDRKGDYVRKWIPELAKLRGFDIHIPFSLNGEASKLNYPKPLVTLNTADL